jgi:hypothetical protein
MALRAYIVYLAAPQAVCLTAAMWVARVATRDEALQFISFLKGSFS